MPWQELIKSSAVTFLLILTKNQLKTQTSKSFFMLDNFYSKLYFYPHLNFHRDIRFDYYFNFFYAWMWSTTKYTSLFGTVVRVLLAYFALFTGGWNFSVPL